MNFKKYFYTTAIVLFSIFALSVLISARFNISNIIVAPYDFIHIYLQFWAPAVSAAGTLFIAVLAITILYQIRREQEREKEYAIRALYDEININLSNIFPLRFRIKHSQAGDSDLLDGELSIEKREALFEHMESEVFENLKNSGKLHFIGNMRMETISCYQLIKEYNRDQYFKSTHSKLLAKIQKKLESIRRNLEDTYTYLPSHKKSSSKKEKSKGGDFSEVEAYLSEEHVDIK